jgi:hypothetical protein
MPAYDEPMLIGYMEKLGIGERVAERITRLIQEYQSFTGTSPEFVFIENPIDDLGVVQFSNLILFKGDMFADFSLDDSNRSVTFVNISQAINRIVMPIVQNLSFTNITARSRLTIQLCNGDEVVGYFNGAGNNCADLLEMATKYLIPAVS